MKSVLKVAIAALLVLSAVSASAIPATAGAGGITPPPPHATR